MGKEDLQVVNWFKLLNNDFEQACQSAQYRAFLSPNNTEQFSTLLLSDLKKITVDYLKLLESIEIPLYRFKLVLIDFDKSNIIKPVYKWIKLLCRSIKVTFESAYKNYEIQSRASVISVKSENLKKQLLMDLKRILKKSIKNLDKITIAKHDFNVGWIEEVELVNNSDLSEKQENIQSSLKLELNIGKESYISNLKILRFATTATAVIFAQIQPTLALNNPSDLKQLQYIVKQVAIANESKAKKKSYIPLLGGDPNANEKLFFKVLPEQNSQNSGVFTFTKSYQRPLIVESTFFLDKYKIDEYAKSSSNEIVTNPVDELLNLASSQKVDLMSNDDEFLQQLNEEVKLINRFSLLKRYLSNDLDGDEDDYEEDRTLLQQFRLTDKDILKRDLLELEFKIDHINAINHS